MSLIRTRNMIELTSMPGKGVMERVFMIIMTILFMSRRTSHMDEEDVHGRGGGDDQEEVQVEGQQNQDTQAQCSQDQLIQVRGEEDDLWVQGP